MTGASARRSRAASIVSAGCGDDCAAASSPRRGSASPLVSDYSSVCSRCTGYTFSCAWCWPWCYGRAEQDQVLQRAASAVARGGRLLVRDVDAAQGLRSCLTTLAERVGTRLGYNRGAALCFRSAREIEVVLCECGLTCEVRPAAEGTPLANVLFVARRPTFDPRP